MFFAQTIRSTNRLLNFGTVAVCEWAHIEEPSDGATAKIEVEKSGIDTQTVGVTMPAIFDLLYREYCRACLAEMRKQLLIAAERPEAPARVCNPRSTPHLTSSWRSRLEIGHARSLLSQQLRRPTGGVS
ncbi:hypothetical protein CO683_40335 [Bradyrhizobium ottawaense]|nr:hypothetical protein CO683_40335 [Bradyrhizobium ottawaense]